MFSIMVKIEGFENRRRNAGLLHIVLGFFLVMKAISFYGYTAYTNILSTMPFLVVAGISLYYGFFRRRIDPTGKNNFWLRLIQAATFIVFAGAMIKVGQPLDYYGLLVWALLTILLLATERKAFIDTVLYIDDSGIKIPGYYKDHLVGWNKISEVVIRHDFMTIFHRNKKYLQYQVMQTLSELELAKMNAFCLESIEASAETEIES
jgi:hypothetical protein